MEFPASVEVVTHANTKTYMEQANPVYGLQTGPQPNIFKANGGRGMPARTFTDRLTIGKGADQIDLYYFGRAHTGGDAYVVFPALGVMHVGDTFPTRDLPIMDKNNGGSGVDYSATLAKAAAVAGVKTVINGHNPTTMTPADVKTLLGVRRRVRRPRAGGEEGRQDHGRRGGVVDDAGQVHRLQPEAGAAAGRRRGRLGRDQVSRRRRRVVGAAGVLTIGVWVAAGVTAAQAPRKLPPLENIRVLKGWDAAQVREEMRRIADALGVKCEHCHVQGNFASDEKSPKRAGRRMLELTLALNARALRVAHAGRGRVAARPHHLLHLPSGRGDPQELGGSRTAAMTGPRRRGGRVRAVAALASWLALAGPAVAQTPAQPGIAESPTITVLKGLLVPQFEVEMRHFVQALGVNCGGCHVPRDFPSEDNPRKAVARRMIEMTRELNARYFSGYTPAEGESSLGRVTCYTCHQGSTQPLKGPAPPAALR